MSELKKEFSDYQKNECEDIQAKANADLESQPIEKELCPTCVKDPNFRLEKNWWQLEEGYLNAKFCEYRVRVYDKQDGDAELNQLALELEKNQAQVYGDLIDPVGALNEEEVRRNVRKLIGIRRLLIKFKKIMTSEVISDLMLVTTDTAEPIYSDPDYYSTLGDVHCVGIPAFNFDQVPPNTDLPKNKSSDETALSVADIILDFNTFNFDWIRLKAALKTYGFFYRAAQHMDNFLVVEEKNPINRVNYDFAHDQCENFQETLDSILSDNGYPTTNMSFGNLFVKKAKKIKFVFNNDDENPFGLRSVLVLPDNGCKDYIELPDFSALDVPEFNVVYNFLANLTAIRRDLTAQESRPWLEFTLDYFYPQLVVDYGLATGDYTAEQKDALSCLLDQQLGLGPGALLDSLTNEVLSFFDVIANELQKEACRAVNNAFAGTPGFKAEEKLRKERKAFEEEQKQKRAQFVNKFKKDFINQIKKSLADELNRKAFRTFTALGGAEDTDRVFFTASSIVEQLESLLVYPQPAIELPPGVTSIAATSDPSVLNSLAAGQITSENDVLKVRGGISDIVVNDPAFEISFDANIKAAKIEEKIELIAKENAEAKFEKTDEKFLGELRAGASPLMEQYNKSKDEKFKSYRKVFDEAKSTFGFSRPSPGTIKLFTTSVGRCGITKLAGQLFKCLLGGLKIEDVMDKIVEVLLDNLKIDMIELLINTGIPANVVDAIQEEIQKQFGDIRLDQLIGLALAQDPQATVKEVTFIFSKAKEIEAIYKKYPRLSGITPDEEAYIDNLISQTDKEFIAEIFDPDKGYEIQVNQDVIYPYNFKGGFYEARFPGKNRKLVLNQIKKAIRDKKKPQVLQGIKRINNFLFNSLPNGAKAIADFNENVEKKLLEIATDLTNDLAQAEGLEDYKRAIVEGEALEEINRLAAPLVEKAKAAYQAYETARRNLTPPSPPSAQEMLADTQARFDQGVESSVEFLEEGLESSIEFLEESWENSPLGKAAANFSENYDDAVTFGQKWSLYTTFNREILEFSNQQIFDLIPEDRKITDQGEYDAAVAAFKQSRLGVKIDAVFDVIFDFIIEELLYQLGVEWFFNELKKYPGAEIIMGLLEKLQKTCPTPPLFYPSPKDFLKSYKLDVCDSTQQITLPKIIVPDINFKFTLSKIFMQRLEDALEKLLVGLLTKLVLGSLNKLESTLCKSIEAVGGFAIDGIASGDFSSNAFLDALDEAFCKGASDENGRSQAEKLANQLFGGDNSQFEGMGGRVTNVIGGVASQSEFLDLFTSPKDEQNPRTCEIIAEAINLLVPEASAILGSPSQVAIFFQNLGSYLSASDKQRIQDLLESGVPNLPLSSAICLTNDQLEEWNQLREDLLRSQGLSPEDARGRVKALNEATIDALGDVASDLAAVSSDDGPFLGPIVDFLTNPDYGKGSKMPEGSTIDDIYDNSESCNDNVHPLNDFRSQQQKEFEEKVIDSQFKSLEDLLKSYFQLGGSILGEAMRDTEDNSIFVHSLNCFFSALYDWIPGTEAYVNSPDEYDGARDTKGQFPESVGLYLRESIISNKSYDPISTDTEETFDNVKVSILFFPTIETNVKSITPGKNIQASFEVGEDNDKYYYDVSATHQGFMKGTFNYRMNVTEQLGKDEFSTVDSSYMVPVSVDQDLIDYMVDDLGFNYGSDAPENIRRDLFNKFLLSKNSNFEPALGLYDRVLKNIVDNVTFEILFDPTQDVVSNVVGVPVGFHFGYKPETLDAEDFEYLNPNSSDPYDKKNEEKILGEYKNSRIVVLNPELYGGTYTNPPIYIEPPPFTGWYDIKDRVFESDSNEGCQDRTPALLGFEDIKKRVKKLDEELPFNPDLSKDPECVSVMPFERLLNKKNISDLDGKVRTTIRMYLVEYFLRSFGLLSNLEYNSKNYDSGFSQYIIGKMKTEMLELGIPFASPFIRIVEKNYWYAFLEQCVEAYARMIEVDGLEPPGEIRAALDTIGEATDIYDYPNDYIKQRYLVEDNKFNLPGVVPNLKEAVSDKNTFYRHAMAYKTYGENIFNSTDEIELPLPETYRMKKIRFYSNIYFLRLAEEQATIVMAEMINAELRRMSKNYSEAPSTKPRIFDLRKHFFGTSGLFEGTTSKVGLRQFFIDKQTGSADPGDIAEILTIEELSEGQTIDGNFEPKLVLEKYIKLVDKPANFPVPEFIKNRQGLKGKVKISEFEDFLIQNEGATTDEKLSDCFGNFAFTYKSSLGVLFNKEIPLNFVRNVLSELNPEPILPQIDRAINLFTIGTSSQELDDLLRQEVIFDSRLLLENESIEPSGVTGELGVKYGMHICLLATVPDPNDEGSFVLVKYELCNSEVDVIDELVSSFRSGRQRFDLECLVNKMIDQRDFRLLFDKIFNLRQISSMAAVYCAHGFAASLGAAPGERSEDIEEAERSPDDWDKTFNKFAKDLMRIQFGSVYMSNDADGESTESSLAALSALTLSNPFNAFKLELGLNIKIPWFRRMRIKTNVFDKNGVECANPLKDLQ